MTTVAETSAATVQLVPIHLLIPSPTNPRKHFAIEELEELASSVRDKGIIQPILARRLSTLNTGGPPLEIICGERRYRAAMGAGLSVVPVIVRDLSDEDVLEIQLIENVQRNALTPLEEARGYRALLDSNPSRYSAAFIADRIGRSEKFVWDRIKLLDAIPEVQELLERERILVGHAELLAKLKPEDQKRALDPHDGGLFQHEARLQLVEEVDDEFDDDGNFIGDGLANMKARTVKELEAWIANKVRFNVQHFAETAPLDFGDVALRVETAAAQPGRGRKVIAITHLHHLADEVKTDSERTYGPRSWKRADGSREDAGTCEFSVLGLVAAGPEYGTAFHVCIARDKCDTHWKEERLEKQRAAKAAAKSGSSSKSAKPARDSWEDQQRKRQEQDERDKVAYARVFPLIVAAVTAKLPKKLDRKAFEYFWRAAHRSATPKATTEAQFVAALILADVQECDSHWRKDNLVAIAKHFGVDVKKLEQQATAAPKAEGKTAAPAKRARKKR